MTASLRLNLLTVALVAATVPVAMAGCTGDSHTIGADDAGTTGDGGTVGDGGSGGEPCGPVTCGEGQVCCNASCGICTAPDEGCITIACEDAGPGPCVDCAAPPPGCRYEGGSCTSCGTLVCDDTCGGLGGGTCASTEYCDYTDGCGFDDGTGICKPRPEACTEDCPGVCGCDGHTYCNACIAASAGVDVLHDGACDAPGDTCGTEAGLTCAGDEFCDYDMGCGFADGAGVCRPRPTACGDVYAPVCGCDGETYGNGCEAEAAGVDVYYVGECETPPPSDCRTTGCPSGQSCQICWDAWACIPDGAVC